MARLYEPLTGVPAELDSVILRDARGSYARRQRWSLAVRWAGAGLAAAAALALALRLYIAHPSTLRSATPAHRQLARVGDVDGNGRVDILDAYVVARAITRHQPLDPAWDVNGDGVVDRKDVDLIARRAVHVSEGAAE